MIVDPTTASAVFTTSLALATVLAALWELRERRWSWPAVGMHLAQGGVVTQETVSVVRWVSRSAVVLRIVAPALLAAGVALRWAAVLSLVGLATSLLLRFKHNTAFMAAGMTIVACGPAVVVWGTHERPGSPEPSAWTLAGVAVLVLGLYASGALTKVQTDQFRTGSTIFLVASTRLPRLTPRIESWPWRVWQAAAYVVVAAEVGLIVLLALPGGLLAALVVGVLLHSVMATIQPGRLIPFQIATLGAYPAASAGLAMLW